jgi:uncharacterized protein YhhL (DUF1145 family)
MQHWNKTAKIKTIILIVFLVIYLIRPFQYPHNLHFSVYFSAFISGILLVILKVKFKISTNPTRIEKPSWNENPFKSKKVLSFSHFASYFLFAIGFGILLGTFLMFQTFNSLSLFILSAAAGIYLGIEILIRKNQMNN